MSQLNFNGISTPVDPVFQTWRELLIDLESTKLSKNQVISSVRFDGDEVNQFRLDEVLDLPLHSIEAIRVEAVATREMLRGAAQEAEVYLHSLQTSMVDVAETFRTGHDDQANLKLQQVFDGAKMLVALLRGIELSLSDLVHNPKSDVEQTLEQMGSTLQELITAQTQKDWTLVADVLEYELAAHMSGLESVVNGFKRELGVDS